MATFFGWLVIGIIGLLIFKLKGNITSANTYDDISSNDYPPDNDNNNDRAFLNESNDNNQCPISEDTGSDSTYGDSDSE